ncbi:hypothetical protein CRN32_07095 [Vibrio vulnificus]|uniref:polysaccharide deacetylase family protein n=1 Tax=Vibrio vulnificus TaxID=672 RepID=UPI000CD24B20|nr:polysaccharide deacetylase family protein [Vibrio vulnificus]MCA3986508.1 polysaccharide deacetylase family protein [Vibrio vulnificus]MDK2603654.1 polysaccharide deacetylase family protein [Vibrio vulnificus]MDK2624338.1 polysaccharide deacetylase family protein [Vibrio vulnificus]MDK2719633.1 polysaccharide deacetylase family protein [Vibrio vulnificus]POC57198.1 hypothetical protein CRN32_07095 [Vibrio vulnificus]
MKLIITVPENSIRELEYSLEVVFQNILSVDYEVRTHGMDNLVIHSQEDDSKRIVFSLCFFKLLSGIAYSEDLTPDEVSYLDLSKYTSDYKERMLPVFFGEASVEVGEEVFINFDLFGTIFFMLSGLASANNAGIDKHERETGGSTFLHRNGLISRPVVDENVWFLLSLLKSHLNVDIKRVRQPKITLTCDVDHPFYRTGGSLSRYIKAFASDLLIRKQPVLFLKRFANLICSSFSCYKFDPYYTFDWYLEQLDKNKIKSSFYFICDHTYEQLDGFYDINEVSVGKLILKLHKAGHSIGVHSSYNSILGIEQIKKEKKIFQERTQALGINLNSYGNRQHYLRWKPYSTPDYLNEAGFEYDSTGSFADLCGFKYGTSFSFPMWSLSAKKKLKLIQKPLILMEASLLSEDYMNMGYDESVPFIKEMYETCVYYGGCFRVLWHNSHLVSQNDKRLFKYICKLSGSYEGR